MRLEALVHVPYVREEAEKLYELLTHARCQLAENVAEFIFHVTEYTGKEAVPVAHCGQRNNALIGLRCTRCTFLFFATWWPNCRGSTGWAPLGAEQNKRLCGPRIFDNL
jgi:hypothetical protein